MRDSIPAILDYFLNSLCRYLGTEFKAVITLPNVEYMQANLTVPGE